MQTKIDFNKYISNAGIKPSFQRIRIMEYIYGNESHPTADQIFKALKPEISTLSKTTVYNTLKLFVEHGIAGTLSVENHETHYDYKTNTHGHFRCELCGKISDFDFVNEEMTVKSLEKHEIKQIQLYVKGICNDCIENN